MGPGEHHCHSGVYSLDAIGIGVDMQEAILFYILGSLAVVCSLGVLLSKNPVSSALYLALTMVGLSFVFVGLDAFFIGMVQLAVYAGAVMVLFVMVVMLKGDSWWFYGWCHRKCYRLLNRDDPFCAENHSSRTGRYECEGFG